MSVYLFEKPIIQLSQNLQESKEKKEKNNMHTEYIEKYENVLK